MAYPKGKKWTEEQKAGIRGRPTWNKGIPRTENEKKAIAAGISEDARKRSSERMQQRWASGRLDFMFGEGNPSRRPEAAAKISEANRLREVTDGIRAKMSVAKKGRPGTPMSEENKKRQSVRMRINNPMQEPNVIRNHPLFRGGCFYYSAGEKLLASLLSRMGLQFTHQKRFARSGRRGYYADFYLPEHVVDVEYDGHHNHYTPEGLAKDAARDAFLLSRYGVKTLRIRRTPVYRRNTDQLIQEIWGFLNENTMDKDQTNRDLHERDAGV